MPAFPRSLSTRPRRATAALSAATLAFGVLAAGSGAATAAPGSSAGGAGNPNAGSSQAFGSIADTTPRPLVNLGDPMRDPAPYTKPTADSGLTWSSVPASPGEHIAQVPLDESLRLANAGAQYRVAHSTTDQRGKVVASTGAIFLPKGTPPEGGWPVLAWAHGTVGMDDICAPSINDRGERDSAYLNHWLSQGYAIVATDYAGLGTPGLMSYLNSQATADSVVDSVIAAHKADLSEALPAESKGQPVLSKKWAVIGQSQGGGAALNVAHGATSRSQPAGLDFRGTVATGAPAYIEEIVLAGGPTFPAIPLPAGLNSYALYILAGFREANPDIDVDSALTKEGRKMVDASLKSCLSETADAVRGTNLARAFKKPLRDVPGLPEALRNYMATPTTGYDRPVFLGHGLADMDVPTPIGLSLNTEMWLKQFSGSPRNARVEVRWYPTDHGGTVPASQVHSTPFLKSIFDDDAAPGPVGSLGSADPSGAPAKS